MGDRQQLYEDHRSGNVYDFVGIWEALESSTMRLHIANALARGKVWKSCNEMRDRLAQLQATLDHQKGLAAKVAARVKDQA